MGPCPTAIMGGLDNSLHPLPRSADSLVRAAQYKAVHGRLGLLLEGEDDLIAMMATAACELHHAFEYFDWTGFYLVSKKHADTLVIGPYQGHLGCLRIPFNRGVCGAAARLRATQLVPDVSAFPGYIACASSTQSEVVVPLVDAQGNLLAVLDVDSDDKAGFGAEDQEGLESICKLISGLYSEANAVERRGSE